MTGQGIICRLDNLMMIPGADKIVTATLLGETIITSRDNVEGSMGILFDCETQLSEEYCKNNNMFRHSNLNLDQGVTGYMEDNRRVRPITLRGIKCSGLWMPLDSLDFIKNLDKAALKEGMFINAIQDVDICKKYVVKRNESNKTKTPKSSDVMCDTFLEHTDTDHLLKNLPRIGLSDKLVITEKLHGTSCRVGNLEVSRKSTWWRRSVFAICMWLMNGERPTEEYMDGGYEYVVGSRRVLKSTDFKTLSGKQHYYATDLWTEASKKAFEGKLNPGETIYFEIVGYNSDGASLMPGHSNEVLKKFLTKEEYDKFISKYGTHTEFSYGQEKGTNGIYVYRITNTVPGGEAIDLSWEQLKTRCEKLGVPHVPELEITTKLEIVERQAEYRGMYMADVVRDDRTINQLFSEYIQTLSSSESEAFPSLIREGICVRTDNDKFRPTIFKDKSYIFKVLEGIIKDDEKQLVNIEEEN